jgi:hypothetical protein
MTSVRCIVCRSTHRLSVEHGADLTGIPCPNCNRRPTLRLERPGPPIRIEPRRIGMYDEPPDDVSDEELLRRRVRST